MKKWHQVWAREGGTTSMNFFSPIYIIWQREVIRYFRDKARIVSTLLQPIFFLVIFGAGFQQTLAEGGNLGVDYIQFMYPGIIAMSIMSVAIFSTISTVWDREFGFLKEILVAPVSRTSIALGKTAGAMTLASMQGLILLLIAPIVGVSLNFISVIQLFGLMILLSFALAGFGLLISSLMKSTESFGIVMQVIIFPMFFVSGAFFPLTAVPEWMVAISKINPLTYGVDAFRQVMLNGQVPKEVLESLSVYPIYLDAIFLIVFLLIMIFLAVLAFNKRN
ncbi:MAG: ABC transporter permease [Patescibacteria group bacterium]|nr:ABC transporter permease [Patescibacteria group bacterium]